MRAVSPGRAAVQDMDTDHGRLYVAMAEKFLDRADTVAPSKGCVIEKWLLWVKLGRSPCYPTTSACTLKANIAPGCTIFFLRRVEPAGREDALSSSSCPFARSAHPELGGHLGLWNAPGGATPAGAGLGPRFARPNGPAGVTKLGIMLEIERLAL